jgi:N-acetylneuraminic acid mutarotase
MLRAVWLSLVLCGCGATEETSTSTAISTTGAGGGTSSSSTVGSGGAGPRGWQSLAPLPSPRQECAVVALNGEVYVIGGFDEVATMVADVAVYTPATDSWRSVAPLPAPRHHANAAALDGRIYVVGSLTTDFAARGEVYVYDPGMDAWTEGTAMPAGTERGGSAVAVLDGTIYVAGGFRGGSVADFSAYDIRGGVWSTLSSLPAPRDHLVAGSIGGSFYAIGGRDGSITGIDGRVDAFDPAAGWSQVAPMLTPRGGCAAATANERVFVFGGEGNTASPTGVFPELESYAPDAWTALEPMPTPRHGTGAAEVDGIIYVPGGATTQAFGAVATHEAYAP